jgi:hypothetical protein
VKHLRISGRDAEREQRGRTGDGRRSHAMPPAPAATTMRRRRCSSKRVTFTSV